MNLHKEIPDKKADEGAPTERHRNAANLRAGCFSDEAKVCFGFNIQFVFFDSLLTSLDKTEETIPKLPSSSRAVLSSSFGCLNFLSNYNWSTLLKEEKNQLKFCESSIYLVIIFLIENLLQPTQKYFM